jgi:glycosyltransferase involved in cell wall biosynthesis
VTRPLVSCIVPTHDAERTVAEALDSILAQTYRPIEVIAADDASVDGTAAIVASYGDRVRYVRHARSGPAATRNLGVAAARGEFVAFLDHDDLWRPEKLAIQMACFDADPGLDACTTHIQAFWAPELDAVVRGSGDDRWLSPAAGFLTTTLLARRSAFERVGALDPGLWFSDAADWFLRAADLRLKVRLLPDVLTLHRLHAASLSAHERGEAARTEFLRLAKATLDRRRRMRDPGGTGRA